AYDSARGRIVMFGGDAAALLADTWEWDGSNWTQRSAAVTPTPRAGHVMAYDASRGKAVLFGGLTGWLSVSAETWEWDGSSWAQATPAAAPAARFNTGLVYDPVHLAVVLFGNSPDDTWRWNGTSWTLVSQARPPRTSWFGLAHDTRRNVVVGVVNYGQL